MDNTLLILEEKRRSLLGEIAALECFRAGCITTVVRPCGKPGCRCGKPGDPGHGPNLRLTYKENGKTRSQALSNPAALKKAQAEIARFRKFQELVREFIKVNSKMCTESSPPPSGRQPN